MTLREQVRNKFEELNFDADKTIDWIISIKTASIEKKKKAFWILTEFPEYGEPKLKKDGR